MSQFVLSYHEVYSASKDLLIKKEEFSKIKNPIEIIEYTVNEIIMRIHDNDDFEKYIDESDYKCLKQFREAERLYNYYQTLSAKTKEALIKSNYFRFLMLTEAYEKNLPDHILYEELRLNEELMNKY